MFNVGSREPSSERKTSMFWSFLTQDNWLPRVNSKRREINQHPTWINRSKPIKKKRTKKGMQNHVLDPDPTARRMRRKVFVTLTVGLHHRASNPYASRKLRLGSKINHSKVGLGYTGTRVPYHRV